MKVVFLIRNVAPGNYGGGEKYQIELSNALKKSGFVPIIITASSRLLMEAKKNHIDCMRAPFFRQQNWSGWKNILLPIYFVWQMKLKHWYKVQIKKYNPCVLNIQSRDEMIGATLAGLSCGKRVLWTDHADFKNWVLWNVNVPLKNIIGKKIVEMSSLVDKVIFVSGKIKDDTEKMVAPLKIQNAIVIRNGEPDNKYLFNDVEVKKRSFVFLGRVVDEKGMHELLEAFGRIRIDYPEATLNIYGDGEIEKHRLMIIDGVVFHGLTNEPLRALAENDIFVLPSYREGLSLSLLDAAMMEKKIITTDVGGNSEVVKNGKTGLLVKVMDIDDLAEAMSWMLEHPKKAEWMAKNARVLYEKEFDFEKIFVEKMLPLYNVEKEKR